jgi:Pyruvate/2-oxoacid:ferredoxin oxidoreductase delta subunit
MKLFVPILRMEKCIDCKLCSGFSKAKILLYCMHGAKVKRFIEEVETV